MARPAPREGPVVLAVLWPRPPVGAAGAVPDDGIDRNRGLQDLIAAVACRI